jgi:hypothetical protein
MKLIKILFSAPVLATLLMIAVAYGQAHGQTQPYPTNTRGVTGKWKATWTQPSGGKPNIIVLTESEFVISGTYTADSGEACPVTGTHTDKIALTVKCSKFEVDMTGAYEIVDNDVNDMLIVGTYIWDMGTGHFQMDRYFCALPEGCPGGPK